MTVTSLLIVAVVVLLIDNIRLRSRGYDNDAEPTKENGIWTVGDVSDSDQIDAEPPEPSDQIQPQSLADDNFGFIPDIAPPSHQTHPHYYSTPMDAASPPPPVDMQSTSRR